MLFSDKLYLMPLPYDEITKNSKLQQNPGWQ
jgi:SusD family